MPKAVVKASSKSAVTQPKTAATESNSRIDCYEAPADFNEEARLLRKETANVIITNNDNFPYYRVGDQLQVDADDQSPVLGGSVVVRLKDGRMFVGKLVQMSPPTLAFDGQRAHLKLKHKEIAYMLKLGTLLRCNLQEDDCEIMDWLSTMPSQLTKQDRHIRIPVELELDVSAWLVYGRAAKVRRQTIGQVLTHVLLENDLGFEERGYKTKIEVEDEREAAKLKKGGAK